MTRALVAVVGVLAAGTAGWELARMAGRGAGDLRVYVLAAESFARGEVALDLFAVLMPTLVLVAGALAPLPPLLAASLWRLASLAAAAGSAALLWRAHRERLSPLEGALGALGAVHFAGAVTTLRLGQVDLLVLFLVVWALDRVAAGRPGTGGAALGLALALKPQAVLLVPGLALLGHGRAAGAAVLVFAAAFAGSSAAVYRGVGVDLWVRRGLPLVLGGYTGGDHGWLVDANQSLAGLLARLAGGARAPALHAAGVAGGLLLAAALLALAARRRAASAGDLWLPAGMLLTGTLVAAPIAWPHYTVLLAPGIVAAWVRLRRGRGAWPVLLFGAALYLVGASHGWRPPDAAWPRVLDAAARSPQLAGSALLLALQVWLMWRPPGPAPGPPAPAGGRSRSGAI